MVHSITSVRTLAGLGREAREACFSGQAGAGQAPAATYDDGRRSLLADAEITGRQVVAAIWGWD